MLVLAAIIPAALSTWAFAKRRAATVTARGDHLFDALHDWPTQVYAKTLAVLLLLLLLSTA